MGQCESDDPNLTPEQKQKLHEEKLVSKKVDEILAKHKAEEEEYLKLLLLGAGESGKSTIFKQFTSLYGKGYNKDELASFKSLIHTNIMDAILILLLNSQKYGPVKAEESKKEIEQLKNSTVITPDIATHIAILWSDPGIQKTYSHRSKFQLRDSAEYYFSKLKQISSPEYEPSFDDVLRSRIPTTSVVKTEFQLGDFKYRLWDVGGQRYLRKKWIPCFESVSGVLFVAGISEYDQVLEEDEKTNRMEETLSLFAEIVGSRWFDRSSFILFLNKIDLFEDKLKKVPLSQCFPEYKEDNSYESACLYVQKAFMDRNRKNRDIYVHFTCGIDSNRCDVVFSATADFIIKQRLRNVGLLK